MKQKNWYGWEENIMSAVEYFETHQPSKYCAGSCLDCGFYYLDKFGDEQKDEYFPDPLCGTYEKEDV